MHAASVCPEPESNSPTKQKTDLSVSPFIFEFDQEIDETALDVPATLQLLKIVPRPPKKELAYGRDADRNRTKFRASRSTRRRAQKPLRDRPPALQRSADGHFVGVLEVAAHGKATREARDPRTRP